MISCQFEEGQKANLRHVVNDAILVKGDQVYLVKRSENLVEGGKWALIGGYLDRDETMAEALVREVKEETGYEIKSSHLLTVLDFPRRNDERQNVSFVYVCEAGDKVSEADEESSEQKWFDLSDLPPREELAFDHFELLNFYKEHKDESISLKRY